MRITAELTLDGDLDTVWEIVSNVDNWATWDPHEEAARLDGPFETGTKGWSKPRKGPAANWTLTAVEPKRRWSSESRIPGGKIAGDNVFEPVAGGKVHCTKTITVSGTLVPLFWLYFKRPVAQDAHKSLTALAAEVARRTTLAQDDKP